MTTSSQTISRTMPGLIAPPATGHAGFASRLLARCAALRCHLQGHEPALCVEERRLYLACPSCRIESRGWELDTASPRPRFAGAPDRFDRYAWIMGVGRR